MSEPTTIAVDVAVTVARNLEAEIQWLLERFTSMTHLTVQGVEVRKIDMTSISGKTDVGYSVSVEVRL